MQKLIVMMPALNEGGAISGLINRIKVVPLPDVEIQVLVVDDGSTDDTAKQAREAGASVISHPKNLGVGAAFRTGRQWALDNGCDFFIHMDSDGQIHPEDIPLVLDPVLYDKADVAFASRFKSQKPAGLKWWKAFLLRTCARFIGSLCGYQIDDLSCGFRCYNRRTLQQLNPSFDYDYIQESLIQAMAVHARLAEIPVNVYYKPVADTKALSGRVFRYGSRFLMITFRSLIELLITRIKNWNWISWCKVGAFILLAAFSLWYRVAFVSLPIADMDELAQLSISHQPHLKDAMIKLGQPGPHQFPLDFVLTWISSHGSTDMEHLRLLPVVWGWLSVLLIFFIGRSLGGWLLGWLAAWLLAISSFHVEYSQILRPYSLTVFLLLLSVALFLRMIKTGRGRTCYALAQILFQLAYPFALCKTVADLFFLWQWKPNGYRWMMGLLVPSLLIPFGWMAFNHAMFGPSAPFAFPLSYLIGFEPLSQALLAFNEQSFAILIFYVLLFVIGVASVARAPNRHPRIYIVALFGLFIVIPFALLFKARLPLYPRYFIAALPLYLLLIACGFGFVLRSLNRKTVFVLLLGAFLAGTLFTSVEAYQQKLVPKVAWKARVQQMANRLSKEGLNADSIVVSNPNFGATLLYYFDRPTFLRLDGVRLRQGFAFFRFPTDLETTSLDRRFKIYTFCAAVPEMATIDEISFQQLRTRVWLVNSHINYFDEENPFIAWPRVERESAQWMGGLYLLPAKGEQN